MNKYLLFAVLALSAAGLMAQTQRAGNTASVDLESGLLLSFQDGDYSFNMGGFIQPAFVWQQQGNADPQYRLNARNAFLRIGGRAVKEKLSFLIQTNFSEAQPLFDAWVAYHPLKSITISAGQKQTFANNREMLFREDRLQFPGRSMLSESLSRTGREFGLFVEGRFGEKFGIAPMLAITSGDGRNSFGVDSRDTDIGGLKYAGRLDIYPLGFFSPGNELFSSDLLHEKRPRLALGAAFSLNRGASNAVGEGHGDFLLYNKNGAQQLPDYRQLYVDLLAKYRGLSLLLEFGNASAAGLSENYLDANAIQLLAPQQISSLLRLGNAYNAQLGYVTRSGFSADLRYSKSLPEFANHDGNLLPDAERYTLGLSKYIKGHNLKLQAAYNWMPANDNPNRMLELLMQMAF